MANLAYLHVFCARRHPRRKMFFVGFNSNGAACYRCPWCGAMRGYKNLFGMVKRVF